MDRPPLTSGAFFTTTLRMQPVHIVGGGLAGCEAAWQLAGRGVSVVLHEMRPAVGNAALVLLLGPAVLTALRRLRARLTLEVVPLSQAHSLDRPG